MKNMIILKEIDWTAELKGELRDVKWLASRQEGATVTMLCAKGLGLPSPPKSGTPERSSFVSVKG